VSGVRRSVHESLTSAQREFLAAAADVGLEGFAELHDVFFFLKDRERRFVYFNRAFVTLMSLTREEILGRRDEDLSPEHLVEHYRHDDEHVLETGGRLRGIIELVHDANGSYNWFATTKYPVRSRDGEIIGVAGITRSVTKRNRAAELLLPLEPAIKLISEQFHRQLTTHELAAAASMSATHFTRLFKSQFGTSPHKYLRRVRLTAGCDLLSTTDNPIGDIATRVGYYDHSHFTNEFARAKGMTPSEYRERHQRLPARRHVVRGVAPGDRP
jgi:PAS domain S-box-containing protein